MATHSNGLHWSPLELGRRQQGPSKDSIGANKDFIGASKDSIGANKEPGRTHWSQQGASKDFVGLGQESNGIASNQTPVDSCGLQPWTGVQSTPLEQSHWSPSTAEENECHQLESNPDPCVTCTCNYQLCHAATVTLANIIPIGPCPEPCEVLIKSLGVLRSSLESIWSPEES